MRNWCSYRTDADEARRTLPLLLSVQMVLFLWGGLLVSPAVEAQSSHYLTGSVGITPRPALTDPNGFADIQSAGEARVNTWNGEIDFSQALDGTHYVYESDSEFIVVERLIRTAGQYVDSVRTSADPGQCYRARLHAVSPAASSISRGSAEQCIEDSCPLLLDMDLNGFHLVGTEDGVEFDLDADGVPEALGWTSRDALDGFLCWDRNRDGQINDGRELFGNSTPLAAGGVAKNGYLAMAELDDPALGGNGDGILSNEDAIFRDLCVWFDLDHDGVSGQSELFTLEQVGVLELDTAFRSSWRRDRFGNVFRFGSRGQVEFRATERSFQTYDVFFATRP